MRVHAWAKRAINGCRSPYRNAGCAMAMPTKRNEAVAAENGRDDTELQARFSIESVRPHAASHVAKEQRPGAALRFSGLSKQRCDSEPLMPM